MPKRNAFLAAVEREVNRRISRELAIQRQMIFDAAIFSANRVFSMGPKRAPKFGEVMAEELMSLAILASEDGKDDKDIVYTKTMRDKRMKRICGEHSVPWEDCYQ